MSHILLEPKVAQVKTEMAYEEESKVSGMSGNIMDDDSSQESLTLLDEIRLMEKLTMNTTEDKIQNKTEEMNCMKKKKSRRKRGGSFEMDISQAILHAASTGAVDAHFVGSSAVIPNSEEDITAEFILQDLMGPEDEKCSIISKNVSASTPETSKKKKGRFVVHIIDAAANRQTISEEKEIDDVGEEEVEISSPVSAISEEKEIDDVGEEEVEISSPVSAIPTSTDDSEVDFTFDDPGLEGPQSSELFDGCSDVDQLPVPLLTNLDGQIETESFDSISWKVGGEDSTIQMIEVMPTLSSLSAPQETQRHSPSMDPPSQAPTKRDPPSDEPLQFSSEIQENLELDVVSPKAIRREAPTNEPLSLTKPEELKVSAQKMCTPSKITGKESVVHNVENKESRNQSPTTDTEVQIVRSQREPLFKANFDDWTPFEESPFEYASLELESGAPIDANGFLVHTQLETKVVPKLKPPASQFLRRNSLRQRRRNCLPQSSHIVSSPGPEIYEPVQPKSPDSVLNHPNSGMQSLHPAHSPAICSIHIPRATVTRVTI